MHGGTGSLQVVIAHVGMLHSQDAVFQSWLVICNLFRLRLTRQLLMTVLQPPHRGPLQPPGRLAQRLLRSTLVYRMDR